MIKVKTNVPIVNMDEQTYKLSDFVEEFKKIELKELKTDAYALFKLQFFSSVSKILSAVSSL
jgi:uncharacterized Fe-S cluster-containing MiaB family protein